MAPVILTLLLWNATPALHTPIGAGLTLVAMVSGWAAGEYLPRRKVRQ